MKIAGCFLVLLTVLLLGATLKGQQKKAHKFDNLEANGKPKRLPVPDTYLGNSNFSGGRITVKRADSLLHQGIQCRDSLGNRYKVVSFLFNYYERMLYEDSAANSVMMVDFFSERCDADTLCSLVASNIYDRIKPGDTILLDKIVVARPGASKRSDTLFARKLKFYFGR